MKRTRNPNDDDDDASSSEFNHRRKQLRLKVKLAEKKSEDEDDQSPQQPAERKHFCVICEKQFSSGKAYGGHVRIHSTEYNNDKRKMKKKKKKRKISLVKKEKKEKEIDLIRTHDMEEGEIRCFLCGKQFQTMHSLYGHMSRHPDRSWNGIRPPDDDDEDDDDDEEDVIMSRSCLNATEDVQEAAWILMMLYYTSIKDVDQEAASGGLVMLHYDSSINCSTAEMEKPLMESPKSELVRSSSCYKGKDNVLLDDDDDDGGMVDMKSEVKVDNNPPDEAKRSIGYLDLNQPPY